MEKINDKLLNWASILEPTTRAQAERTATMPFVWPHLALMPDAHLGKGATVGSVIPTLGAVIPAAVGVDIGCGMMAIRTQFTESGLRSSIDLAALRTAIELRIPLSAGKYNARVDDERTRQRVETLVTEANRRQVPVDEIAANWTLQLGSLGSGNHFIEVSADQEGAVWLFLHSGSRGVGNKLAQRHIAVAQDLMKRYFIELPDPDLAYLVQGTAEFDAYLDALDWAQQFAYLNREEMMDRVIDAVEAATGEPVERRQTVNCHHNYTAREKVYGRDGVIVSRKGAISAKQGELGLIPGSMGTRSYVVSGLGNRQAINSAPHGAGRNFSRSKARKTFTAEQLRAAMAGIEYRDTDAFIDEIPAAYKDIDQVMSDAADLVQPLYELHQLVNVKGD
ncbi:RtcB family protein [Microlunatus soli]|uniref:3'-phosphate/5'-hydroxy nucleic acid ligase n=1 Tax=Microlunatus soli TaxID=630515 RepID=A0A1H1XRH3_9ACTN|nr:RtcB family protein [Microlunatus soli]SDT11406.1 tRNA-splicing ligase RtcB [Microlunatus soli]